jgi:hypothetical protein
LSGLLPGASGRALVELCLHAAGKLVVFPQHEEHAEVVEQEVPGQRGPPVPGQRGPPVPGQRGPPVPGQRGPPVPRRRPQKTRP